MNILRKLLNLEKKILKEMDDDFLFLNNNNKFYLFDPKYNNYYELVERVVNKEKMMVFKYINKIDKDELKEISFKEIKKRIPNKIYTKTFYRY